MKAVARLVRNGGQRRALTQLAIEPAAAEPALVVSAPAPAVLTEVPPAEAPTAAPADVPKPSVEEPSALMEAFSRVTQAAEQLNAAKDADDERKAG